MKTKIKVVNETEKKAVLYLYGTIRKQDPWDNENSDVISSKRVRDILEDVKGKDLTVHINSGGGDVFESIAIGNLFKAHDGAIEIIVDSLAGSGASVITASANKVKMYDNSMQMIHKAMTYAFGNADEIRKQADDLDKIDSSVMKSYLNKFVGTEEELKNLIKEETWLTAEECLTFGFCNEIIQEEKLEDSEEKSPEIKVKENLFNKYKKDIKMNNDKNQVGSKEPTLFNAFFNKKEGEDK